MSQLHGVFILFRCKKSMYLEIVDHLKLGGRIINFLLPPFKTMELIFVLLFTIAICLSHIS